MEFLGELTKNGILGILLGICIVALYRLYNDMRALQTERVSDLKEINTALIQPLENIRTTVARVLEILSAKK